MSNEIISKFMGEPTVWTCDCQVNSNFVSLDGKSIQSCCTTIYSCGPDCNVHPIYTDYENDLGAWTQEVYRKIEEAGLVRKYFFYLMPTLPHWRDEGGVGRTVAYAWRAGRASPAQKSLALSQAIMEVGE